MDIQDLLIFSRVAALQNLSAVGTELGLTPGTISKRIQALEEAFDVRLFERTTRSIRITEEGTQFLEHVESALQSLDKARDSMAARSKNPVGKLRISAPFAIGRLLVAPAIPSFMEAYPEIEINLDFADRLVNLHEEGYDIAIRSGALDDSTLISKRLAVDKIVIAGSPSYLAAKGTPATPAELAGHQCLAHGDNWSWAFGSGSGESCVRVPSKLRSDNTEVLLKAAIDGAGLIRTTQLAIADELASGQLVSVLEHAIDNSGTGVYALYVKARHVLPRHRVFLDHMAEWFRANRKSSPDSLTLAPRVQAASGSGG